MQTAETANLFNKSMKSSGRDDQVTSALQSAGEASTNHVHVITLCLKVHYFVWLRVLRCYHLGHFVPQLSVRAV